MYLDFLTRLLDIIFWVLCAAGIICLIAFVVMRVMTKYGYSFEFHREDDDD